MGQRPIAELQPADILTFFRQLEAQGIHETGAKIRRALVEAFDLAAFSGRVHANPVRGVERFVETPKNRNYAHVSMTELPDLLHAVDQYPRSAHVRCAVLLLALNGCRSTELREARWDEFDLDNALWHIVYMFTSRGLKEATQGYDLRRVISALRKGESLYRTGSDKVSVSTRTSEGVKKLYHVLLL